MPVQATWDNSEKTVILLNFEGNWTWEETYEAVEQRNRLVETVANDVDLIVNFGEAGLRVPPNAITHTRKIMSYPNDQIGRVAIVGFKSIHITLWNVVRKIYSTLGKNDQFILVASLDEAREVLTKTPQ